MTSKVVTPKTLVGAAMKGQLRILLKPSGTEAAPVSVLVSFAAVRGRPRRAGQDRSSRSQTALT
jgi:hypothetical protein